MWLKGSLSCPWILYIGRKKELFHALSNSEAFSIAWKAHAGKLVFKFDFWILKMSYLEDYVQKETMFCPFSCFRILQHLNFCLWICATFAPQLSPMLTQPFLESQFNCATSAVPHFYSIDRTSVLVCPCVGEQNQITLSLDFKVQANISKALKEIFDETLYML